MVHRTFWYALGLSIEYYMLSKNDHCFSVQYFRLLLIARWTQCVNLGKDRNTDNFEDRLFLPVKASAQGVSEDQLRLSTAVSSAQGNRRPVDTTARERQVHGN